MSSLFYLVLIMLTLIDVSNSALPVNLSPGSSFSLHNNASDALLVSPNGEFSFGFRSLDDDQHFYLALWYSSLDRRIVWLANPDLPALASALFSFSSDGDMQLLSDSTNSPDVLWKSDTMGLGVLAAQLENSGNLVLLNASRSVWQSFDYPTDTLLPTQWLQVTQKLISRKNQGSSAAASGFFQLAFDQTDGIAQLSRIDFPPYFNANATVDGFSDTVALGSQHPGGVLQLNSSGILSFYAITGEKYMYSYPIDFDNTPNPVRRVSLDVDGNLRTHSWDNSSNSWITVWGAIPDPCKSIPRLCGRFGVCIHNPYPACVCPPGYEMTDPTDISQGCTQRIPINESSCGENTQFVKLQSTNFPNFDIKPFTDRISLNTCLDTCMQDCSCLLAAYRENGDGQCWLKSNAYDGQQDVTTLLHSFVKVSTLDHDVNALNSTGHSIIQWSDASFWSSQAAGPTLPPPSSSPDENHIVKEDVVLQGKKKKEDVVIIIISTIAFAELVCLGISLWFLRKFRRQSERTLRAKNMTGAATSFSFQELELATNHFSDKLGEGGFGTVFRGRLSDGRMVAVKRLEAVSSITESQFRAEIVTLGKIHHVNLVRLYGFCAEGTQRLLVYELLENGSLDALLFTGWRSEPGEPRDATLNWGTRFAVCVGVARGLTYLHEECLDCIVHCDIKPQNILLDRDFCPKVTDFGLSYLFSRNVTLHVSSIRGTRGYLAPEWLANLPITGKADVYSFGMVMMEILGGRKNYEVTDLAAMSSRGWNLPEWAYEQISDGRMYEVLDPSLTSKEHADFEEMERVMRVAFLCIQRDPQSRPAMRSVVQMLEGTLAIPRQLPARTKLFDASPSPLCNSPDHGSELLPFHRTTASLP